MGDLAGRWIRVSGDSQSERDQIPDINRYCRTSGYAMSDATLFTVHGKSAFHGDQMPDWAKVVEAFRLGIINVIVIWMVDRLDRQNVLHAIPMVNEVLSVGGRIEFSEQPECNLDANDPNLADKVEAFARYCAMAHKESRIKSKRVIKKHDVIREHGGLIGRPPFGFTSAPFVCDECTADYGKETTHQRLIPGEWSRYVITIFELVADGRSLVSVAEFLDSQNVPTNSKLGEEWSAKSISQIIRNRTYLGTRINGDGNVGHECESLVSQELFDAANRALDNTPSARRGRPVTNDNPAMLTGVICDNCQGRMSRIFSGKGSNRIAYYRCHGKGSKPKGCGIKMVRCDYLDSKVSEMLSQDTRPIMESVFVPGSNNKARLAEIRGRMARLDPFNPAQSNEYNALMAEGQSLTAAGETPDHWIQTDSGETFGSRWASLNSAGKREFIANDTRIIFKWERSGDELIAIVAIVQNAPGMTVEIQTV